MANVSIEYAEVNNPDIFSSDKIFIQLKPK